MTEVLSSGVDRALLIETLEKGVFRIYRSLRQQPALKDMSPQDPVLLKQIARRPGISLGDLATLERLRASTITSHVTRLTAAGLVRRLTDKNDRRRAGLVITAKGRRAIDLATSVRYAFLAEGLSSLEEDEIALLAAAAPIFLKLGGNSAEEPPEE